MQSGLSPQAGRGEELSHRSPADDGKAESARDEIDRGDRDQDHQDQERHFLPFQHADLLGQLQANAAGADNADDGGRAGIRFDKIEHLTGNHRQYLRHQAKSYFVQRIAARRPDAFDLLAVSGLDRLGEQLAERAEIRHRNREHAGEGTETDDIDPDQRPDQRVDAADRSAQSHVVASDEVIDEIRLTVKAVLPDAGMARFNLNPSTASPSNAFVPIKLLQERLKQPQRANALMVAGAPESLAQNLRSHLTLEDWGLVLYDPTIRTTQLFEKLGFRPAPVQLARYMCF